MPLDCEQGDRGDMRHLYFAYIIVEKLETISNLKCFILMTKLLYLKLNPKFDI